jgi:hypothetical protein
VRRSGGRSCASARAGTSSASQSARVAMRDPVAGAWRAVKLGWCSCRFPDDP